MLRVYCDFDGTVCMQDVLESLFRHYCEVESEKLIRKLLNQELTVQQWYKLQCKALPPLSKDELYKYMDQFNVDPSFKSFSEFCYNSNIPLVILSDGLDFYIEHILKNAGLQHIKYYSNKTIFNGGKLDVEFPYSDSECNLCGNCKRNHLLNLSADEDIIVYVGDGYSDKCPVKYADIVFAKRHLIKYCQMQNISYFSFSSFADVESKLKEILQRKRIKQRQEAKMARKEVFMQG